MIDKRRYLRIPLSLPIKFKRIGYIIVEGNLSKDLSVQGIKFLSQKFVPVQSFIKIEIYLKDNHEPVKFIANVAWIKSVFEDELFEIGAKIVEISREDSFILREALGF